MLSGAPVSSEGDPMTGANSLTGRDWFRLLSTLAQARQGATQRSVAQELGGKNPATRFGLRHPEGTGALALLRGQQPQ